MKIIYISIAVILLGIGSFFAYKWYKGTKAPVTATATSAPPHLVASVVQGTPVATHVSSTTIAK